MTTLLLLWSICVAAAQPTLEPLTWLAGDWVRDDGQTRSEEHWMPPSGDSMVGMFRLQEGGETKFVELLTIVVKGEHVALRIRHMTSELSIWQSEVDGPVVFTLASMSPSKAVFASPSDDVRELHLERLAANEMRVRLVFAEEGKVVDYPFTRVAKP